MATKTKTMSKAAIRRHFHYHPDAEISAIARQITKYYPERDALLAALYRLDMAGREIRLGQEWGQVFVSGEGTSIGRLAEIG